MAGRDQGQGFGLSDRGHRGTHARQVSAPSYAYRSHSVAQASLTQTSVLLQSGDGRCEPPHSTREETSALWTVEGPDYSEGDSGQCHPLRETLL